MTEPLRPHERWAQLRFSIVGPLLAAPPPPGELRGEIVRLASKSWRHPIHGGPLRFGFSTIERWYHQARRAKTDPVAALGRKIRKDAGRQDALTEAVRGKLLEQHGAHPSWSYQLHHENLAAQVKADPALGPLASYATLRRFMLKQGLVRRRRLTSRTTPGAQRAEERLERREVRSFEAEHVHALWHLDFHHGSRKILTPAGQWVTPLALGVLDDRSRLACHLQWYLAETAENLVHGLGQALQKRAVPRALMTDNGGAMTAAETLAGLHRLGILHRPTLPYSPYQNAKQEVFWAQLEGRLLAMLEGVEDLTLALLNEATQAWVEMDYQRRTHSETRQTPLDRYLQGPDVGRPAPDSATLRLSFMIEQRRTQRRSDGTVSLAGRRFEIPARYRPLRRVCLRHATWDLAHVYLVDEHTGHVLCRLWPLDKARNANRQRRALPQGPVQETSRPAGMAPLLRQFIADYAATGLPPAYLPKAKDGAVLEVNDPEPNPPQEMP